MTPPPQIEIFVYACMKIAWNREKYKSRRYTGLIWENQNKEYLQTLKLDEGHVRIAQQIDSKMELETHNVWRRHNRGTALH